MHGRRQRGQEPTWKMIVKILKRKKDKKKDKKEKWPTDFLLYTFLLSNDQWV